MANARELHAFLESKQEFAHWIGNRIEKYGFVEGSDYHLSLDMAKELSMVERSDKGKMARQYFIAMEKLAYKSENEFAFELATLTTQNHALRLALLKADANFKALQVMHDGGLDNSQMGLVVGLAPSTVGKKLTQMRKLGLIGERKPVQLALGV